jgi:hypothetical protein
MSEFVYHSSEASANQPADSRVSDRPLDLQVTNTPPDLPGNDALDRVYIPPPPGRGRKSTSVTEPVFVRERIDPTEHNVAEPKRYAYDFAPPPEGVEPKPQFGNLIFPEIPELEAAIGVAKDFLYQQSGQELPGEVSKTPEELTRHERFAHALVAIGDDADIDIRDRIAPPSRLHVFESEDQYRNIFNQDRDTSSLTELPQGFFYEKLGAVILRNEQEPIYTDFVAAHEELHGITYMEIGLYPPSGDPVADADIASRLHLAATLFAKQSNATGNLAIEESIVDMITYKAKILAGDPVPEVTGHVFGDIVLEGMMKAVAQYHEASLPEVEKYIIKGALAGTYGTGIFYRSMNEDGVDYFERSTVHTKDEAHNLINYLFLPAPIAREAHLKISKCDRGNPVAPFEWLYE